MVAIARDCCSTQIKYYNVDIFCRLCWRCQSCGIRSCDKYMYGTTKLLEDKLIQTKFLSGYTVVDKKGKRHHPAPRPEKFRPRGPDCSVVIMKTHEVTRVYVREPVNIAILCDDNNVRFSMHQSYKMDDYIWICDIGPIDNPLVATITIDNKALPLIVTD